MTTDEKIEKLATILWAIIDHVDLNSDQFFQYKDMINDILKEKK